MALPPPVSFTANSSADYWLTVVCLSATNSPTRLFAYRLTLKARIRDMKSPPLAGFLHFKGLISNIQKLY